LVIGISSMGNWENLRRRRALAHQIRKVTPGAVNGKRVIAQPGKPPGSAVSRKYRDGQNVGRDVAATSAKAVAGGMGGSLGGHQS
jgi:hypothetical protein